MATITGFPGDDRLPGTDKDDTIDGREGFDFIDGRGGNDKLIGGRDADTFYINRGDGSDWIVDFTSGLDLLVLNGFQRANRSDLAAYIDFNGDSTTIDLAAAEDFGGGTMLVNVTGGGISTADIVFDSPFPKQQTLLQEGTPTFRPPDDPRSPTRFAGGVLGESGESSDWWFA
jgi:Ca2+-binding RTX toxin-like protein